MAWNPVAYQDALNAGLPQSQALLAGGDPSQPALSAQFQQTHPQYAPVTPIASAPSASSGGLVNSLGGMFSSPSQLQGFAPQDYQAFGSVPYIDPTFATAASGNAALVDPSQVGQYHAQGANAALVDPSQVHGYDAAFGQAHNTGAAQTDYSTLPQALQMFQQQIATGLAPEFQRQDQALGESQAARGIFNSGAAIEGSNDLSKQQDGTLAQALAPLTQQFAQYYQQDQLGNTANQQAALFANQGAQNAQEMANQQYANQARAFDAQAQNQFLGANQGNQQQTNLANQQYGNQANEYNAQAWNQFLAANQQAQNNQNLTNQQYQQQTGMANQAASNQAAGANAAAYGTVTQNNMSQYNSFLQQLMQYQNAQNQNFSNAYLGSYGANTGAISLLGNYGSGTNPYAGTSNNGGQIGSTITNAINSFAKPSTPSFSPWVDPTTVMGGSNSSFGTSGGG